MPVITANAGGMAEYVRHEVNGLLFPHRSFLALSEQMQRFVDQPQLAADLGARGYLYSDSGDVPGIESHVRQLEALYDKAIMRRYTARVQGRTRTPATCAASCARSTPPTARDSGNAKPSANDGALCPSR